MADADADVYTTRGLPPPPAVSVATMAMAGLLVDVYGLDELPADAAAPVTCLWLLHARTRTRARMADVARRAVAAWNAAPRPAARGLVALAFDLPNHGSRLVSARANAAWDAGNARHAVDLAALVRGAAADVSLLVDLAPAYLDVGARVDAHVALGWSLGGHAAWQAVVAEPRLDAAVVVVGCPDLLGERARRRRRRRHRAELTGPAAGLMLDRAMRAGFVGAEAAVGGRLFPDALVDALAAHDVRAVLLGGRDGAVPAPPLAAAEQARLRRVLDARLRGKRLLLCSGGDDTLVPHARTRPLAALLADAAAGWYADGGLEVEDRVYAGEGHCFSAAMVLDAVAFLLRVVAEGPRERRAPRGDEASL